MKKEKTILFCGNGMSGEAIKEIKLMGYKVILITDFMNDRGIEDADTVIQAETKNVKVALDASIELYKAGHRFDGVLSLCWDCPISVAKIAQYFNLLGITPEVAESATIKSLRSAIFEKYQVPAPRFKLAKNFAEAYQAAQEIGFPVVLKPLDQSSSKGVILVDTIDHFESAYRYSTSFSIDPHIIVNEYLVGSEHSTEGLMIDGKLYPTALSDREFKYAECKPFFVEIGDIMPSSLSPEIVQSMWDTTEKAALALGITKGVVKGDMIYCKDGQVRVLELTPRLGGPRFGTEMVPLSNGTAILKAAVQQAVGDPIDMDYLKVKYARGMVNRSLFPEPGIIQSISGLDKIQELPGYYDFKWWFNPPPKPGDRILPSQNTCGGFAYFITVAPSREEAIKYALDIENNIQIEMV